MKYDGQALIGEELNNKISSLKEVGGQDWVVYYLEDNGANGISIGLIVNIMVVMLLNSRK